MSREEAYRYNAFISYRRTPHDTQVAREVQQSLEHFRIPPDLRKQIGLERIDRIFRDTEELEITADLSGRLESALASSEFLIVICSPEYGQSPWCLHELESFIRMRGHDHVLCVLSAGDPPSVFPEVLLHRTREATAEDGSTVTVEEAVEPMACDYRGNLRKARRTELPRLAAAMLGCSYDDLVMRRERYRRRRMTALISAATIAASLAIAYLIWSNAQISGNYRQALISESRLLASESLEALDHQNRLLALQNGLQALVGSDPNRPVTDEALFALSRATYSYTTPFNVLETWRIDQNSDITEWFISRDGHFLVCVDRTGEFSCYDLGSKTLLSRFRLPGKAVPSAPVDGLNGELFCYAGGEVFSVNYLAGEVNWREPMPYGRLGAVQLSTDGRFLAAADSAAVWIMTAADTPYAGLLLPDSEDSFITNLCWSSDGSQIAVELKESGSGRESVGMFEVETGAFTRLDCSYINLDLVRFDEDNTLYVLGDNRFGYSTEFDDITTLHAIPFELSAYLEGERLWSFETAEQVLSEAPDLQVLRMNWRDSEGGSSLAEETADEMPWQKRIYFSLGSKVYVLDENGGMITYLEMHRDVIRLLSITPDTVTFITADGDRGTGWPGIGSCLMSKTFPNGLDRIEALSGNSDEKERFAALSSGDLYVYESVSDENIRLIEGEGFPYAPDGLLRDGNLALLLTNGTAYFYNLESHRQLAVTALPEGNAWHLLTALDGKAYLLRIQGNQGNTSVCCLDMESGQLTGEIPLPVSDYISRTGVTQAPFSHEDALYTAFLYETPSAAAVNGELLYIHDDRSNTVFCVRLTDGSITERNFFFPEGNQSLRLISDESGYPLASPLAISPDGRYLFTAGMIPDTGDHYALLADLADDSMIVLPGEPQDLSSVAFAGRASASTDAVLYSGSHELFICSTEGELLDTIPWTGDKPLSFAFHDGKLYCVFRDSTLRVFQDRKQIRSIPLTFTLEQAIVSGRDFRYEFRDQQLYLFCGAELNAISLDGEGTTPLYAASSVLERLETGELILYSWPPASEDLFSAAFHSAEGLGADRRFYLAFIPEYSTEKLLERAEKQLQEYLPESYLQR